MGAVTVAGLWENEYGSRMALMADGATLFGIYESTTGSTGRYLVAGRQALHSPASTAGLPVALAIGWHSVADGVFDPGWHWTSALGGQVNIRDGQEVLEVSHLLVATAGLPGICEHGLYLDRLSFRRVSGAFPALKREDPGSIGIDNRIAGTWSAGDMILDIAVFPGADGRLGLLRGSMSRGAGRIECTGFTDVKAQSSEHGLQSVAIAANDEAGGTTLALGGWIDPDGEFLRLTSLVNRATSAENSWVQTTVEPLLFRRDAMRR